MTVSNRGERILNGAVAGVAAWLLLVLLGVPHIFGLDGMLGLVMATVVGAVAALSRMRLVLAWTTVALLCVMAFVAFTGIMSGPARRLIRADKLPSSADAVVALSAGVTADGHLTQQGTDRTLEALELVKTGIAPVMVFTREERRIGRTIVSSSGDQLRLAALVGVHDVLTTGPVSSTHDEALAVKSLAQRGGWRRIVLVTSPFHSRRACATFEKAGLIVSCVPGASRDVAVGNISSPGDRLGAFAMWLYETAGTLRYRQLGWL